MNYTFAVSSAAGMVEFELFFTFPLQQFIPTTWRRQHIVTLSIAKICNTIDNDRLTRVVMVAALRNPPEVDDIHPRYGPATGNTSVTITGSQLNRTELRYVYYGAYKWKVTDPRYLLNEYYTLPC